MTSAEGKEGLGNFCTTLEEQTGCLARKRQRRYSKDCERREKKAHIFLMGYVKYR